jgi:4-carboxymuconolactone decarboxylase
MRLTPIDRNNLDQDQQKVLEAIEHGPRGNWRTNFGTTGPFGAWVRAPSVGGAIQRTGEAIRFGTSLPANVQEVAICTVGAFYRSKFEFSAHQALAIKAGVSEAGLRQIKNGELPTLSDNELLSYQIARQMLTEHGIQDETYRQGVKHFTQTGMIELVATIGYYCLISLTLNSFKIPLEADMADPFPEDS